MSNDDKGIGTHRLTHLERLEAEAIQIMREVVAECEKPVMRRTISSARDRGIPFLYTEAWGAGRIAAADLEMMKRGTRNLLRHLGIIAGDLELPVAPPRRLRGVGNTDEGISATRAGFLIRDVALLDRVAKGQRLGRLINDFGETMEEYFSPFDATVGLTREMPVVEAGDTLFLVAVES